MAQRLKLAAERADINGLYESTKEDPNVLDRIDAIRFVDTPLHTATSAGHIDFAIEILRLMPSFGMKLNPNGQSSLHLALINEKFETVKGLINFDKKLIRVKGREGITPLHFIAHKDIYGDMVGHINANQQQRVVDRQQQVADPQQRGADQQQRVADGCSNIIAGQLQGLVNQQQRGDDGRINIISDQQQRVADGSINIIADHQQGVADQEQRRLNILAEFLFACPNSIEDLTNQDETALHIAVKTKNEIAVQVILGCICRIERRRVLAYKDEKESTALDVAVSTSQPEIARSLRSARVSSGLRAWFVSILRGAGALKSSSPDPSLAEFLNSPERVSEILFKQMFHMNRAVSMELRNIGLVVAVLIATATYQAALSPPGGIGDDALIKALTNGTNINGTVSSTNNLFAANTSSINATSFTPTHEFKLLVIRDELVFLLLYGSNTFAFVFSMLMMMFLLPFKPFGILHVALFCMMCSYGVLLFLVSA
ncbi:hypothetical protein Vadar_024950 [Vaccinium darrowii]|uniref:Uncharacterized protein n=1 Tax=Vaccinium darrowii TaxID=229202 RepID=A0ACB7ZMP2_9ERIC|nr:hypothetical protein Vadar_024950 [Vaccinium darrowii]